MKTEVAVTLDDRFLRLVISTARLENSMRAAARRNGQHISQRDVA